MMFVKDIGMILDDDMINDRPLMNYPILNELYVNARV